MTEASTIRRAGPDDVAACARVVHNWITGTDWMPNMFSLGELEGMFRNGLPLREIYVIGDPIAGYLSFNPGNKQVVGLYTARPGAGLGKALMDHVKAQNDYLQLWTHEPNKDAHRFYGREGFSQIERKAQGDDGLPEYRMEWHGVKRAGATDAEPCADILNAWIDATDWMPRVHPDDDVRRHYREFVFENREVWVIGNPVQAYVSLDHEDGFVAALYSAKPGQGLGKRLLDHAKTRGQAWKLWTFVANENAQRFYAREGFAESDRSDGDNEENLPDIQFQWRAG